MKIVIRIQTAQWHYQFDQIICHHYLLFEKPKIYKQPLKMYLINFEVKFFIHNLIITIIYIAILIFFFYIPDMNNLNEFYLV